MGKVKRRKTHKQREEVEKISFSEKHLHKGSELFKGLRDIGIAVLVVAVILGSLWWYAGTWPPVVVVESGSMMHDDDSMFGVIDTGDIVVVKEIDSRGDIKTWVEGEQDGYETYSDYGDVIIYYPLGRTDVTPIIHRAILWLEVNTTEEDPENWTYSIPSRDIIDQNEVKSTLETHGLHNYEPADAGHSGFITRGDNNFFDGRVVADQDVDRGRRAICPEPVEVSWIAGVARGEMPWFGLIKLWVTGTLEGSAPTTSVVSLSIVMFLLIGLPIIWDIYSYSREKDSYFSNTYSKLFGSLGVDKKSKNK